MQEPLNSNFTIIIIIIITIILLENVGNARLEEQFTLYKSKTPAPQYKPVERKKNRKQKKKWEQAERGIKVPL